MANLDWNKTKTIFIIVFSILNVFLFSLYLNRYNDALNIEEQNDTPIEESLLSDNIKVPKIESFIQEASYVSGNVHLFRVEELNELTNQTLEVKDGYELIGTFKEPLPITTENSLEKLVKENVIRGDSYRLWKIDEEEQSATFFQEVNDRLVYHNQNAQVIVYWNDEKELLRYEQSILDNLEDYNESRKLVSPTFVIRVLYSSSLLKADSTVKDIKLGYSTLAQLTETQVFAPTWYVPVELSDGTMEEYFVNAVEGRVSEIPKKTEQPEVK
ncbi:two-component system regulatory protein YycI [Psychrobacillus sp. NPDC096426]|uniref:two-component system regulatory protein YycI n=1 Tax=Psychrobacillus sp. NPDC096426 TaxID=3364491 RepID=UPI00380AF67F